jgi:hypothetical protein
MLYLVIFFILTIFIVTIFIMKIKIVADYVRNENDDNISISLYTLKGIFKYKYDIPLVDLGQKSVKFKLVKEMGRKDKKLDEKTQRLKLIEILDKYVFVKGYYDFNKELIIKLKKYLKFRLVLDEFHLQIKEGTGNACLTGLLCGVFWSLAGVLTSFLSNSIETKKKYVSIEPDFNAMVFIVDFYCIFRIKLVHIIVLVMKFYFSRKKEKIEKEIGGGLSG